MAGNTTKCYKERGGREKERERKRKEEGRKERRKERKKERKKEREREREKKKEREREKESYILTHTHTRAPITPNERGEKRWSEWEEKREENGSGR